MSRIEESVSDVADLLDALYAGDPPAEAITSLLIDMAHYCDHTRGVSWARCLEAARRQHDREIAEDALTRPMPAK